MEWYDRTTRRPPGRTRAGAECSNTSTRASSSSLTTIRRLWNTLASVAVLPILRPFLANSGTTEETASTRSEVVARGRASTIAVAIFLALGSSPYTRSIRVNSATSNSLHMSAADIDGVAPAVICVTLSAMSDQSPPHIRISSGPAFMKANPRSAVSIWCELMPRSSNMPSTPTNEISSWASLVSVPASELAFASTSTSNGNCIIRLPVIGFAILGKTSAKSRKLLCTGTKRGKVPTNDDSLVWAAPVYRCKRSVAADKALGSTSQPNTTSPGRRRSNNAAECPPPPRVPSTKSMGGLSVGSSDTFSPLCSCSCFCSRCCCFCCPLVAEAFSFIKIFRSFFLSLLCLFFLFFFPSLPQLMPSNASIHSFAITGA
mmetsp:Transcript_36871/g.80701  ORF Transcript_36871/g.80701 Transcript_36871/m.80701 type:complete len:374 (-) Transcript_36871:539-1660(-)